MGIDAHAVAHRTAAQQLVYGHAIVLAGDIPKRLVDAGPAFARPVGLAFAAALGINMAASALFSLPYAKYVFGPETRERFLAENVSGFEAARRLNAEPGVHRVLVMNRHFQFYIDAPSFFAFPHRQKQIETRPGHVTPARLAGQLLDSQITHLLSDIPTSASLGPRSMDTAIPALAAVDCLRSVSEFETPWHLSRTLPTLSAGTIRWGIWKIDAASCAQTAGR